LTGQIDVQGDVQTRQKVRRMPLFSRVTHDVLRILAAQAAMGLFAALVCGAVAGIAGLASAAIGAAAYLLPNAVFAMRLLLGLAGTGQASALTFFVGQLVKTGLTVTGLMLAAWLARDWLVWPALLFGLCCTLMGYALLPLFSRLLRKPSR